jgi:hypothetical protein
MVDDDFGLLENGTGGVELLNAAGGSSAGGTSGGGGGAGRANSAGSGGVGGSTSGSAGSASGAGGATSAGGSTSSAGGSTSGSGGSASGAGGATSTHCDDGLMNDDETGVDCAGSCAPCLCAGDFGEPDLVTGVGTAGNYYSPSLSLDNQTLYFSRELDGDEDLYLARRDDRGSAFSGATSLDSLNTYGLEGSAYVTPDGLTLYFFSDRSGGPGLRDLWTATRASTSADFGAVEVVANVNSSAREHLPWLTPDRLGLLFASDRSGGQGGWDIWIAERDSSSEPFRAPRNLTELNMGGIEQGVTLSRDGLTIIFSSDRGGGQGATDLWMATRSTPQGSFSAPVNFGDVNGSDEDDEPKLSNDGQELFFSSSRGGVRRLWHALRSCE